MSRICVKNIGKNTKEDDLKELFSSKGEITDVRVMRTKDGKSRQFAFIGFRNESQAEEARKFFNNTFIGLSRISIEIAKKVEGKTENTSQAKLKGTEEKLKSLRQQLLQSSKDSQSNEKKAGSGSAGKTQGAGQEASRQPAMSKKKAEFLSVAKGQTDMFLQQAAIAPVNEKKESDSDDSEDEDDDDDESATEMVSEEEEEQEGQQVSKPLTDLDYLRSKVSKSVEFDDDDDNDKESLSSGDEEDDAEDEDIEEGSNMEEEVPQDNLYGQEEEEDEEDELDDSRLFIKNLPFGCSEEDLKELCEKFGTVSEVHIPITAEKKAKGFGFVQFLFPQDADKALKDLDGDAFQGRILHVQQALRPKSAQSGANLSDVHDRLSAFKKKKEEERRKMATRKDGWNAAYVRSDTVVDALAQKYGVENADILDVDLKGGDLAVRMAIGETQIVQENHDYLAGQGVNLDALESANSSNKGVKRSPTTLLVKNLPPDSQVAELESMFSKFGGLAAFIVPPSKTLLVVDYTEPTEARAALKGLAYRRYKNSPLYIEYAPMGVLQPGAASKASAGKKEVKEPEKEKEEKTAVQQEKVEEESEDTSTVFIKNLSFSTTEQRLEEHINNLRIPGLRTVVIRKKQKGQQMLSMGYGFAEFSSTANATMAVERLNRSVLDEHQLEVKPSEKKLTTSVSSAGAASTKLLVRNIAFQASRAEVKALLEAFGSVKTVRMPKQMKSTQHRGFAFVEFHTKQEAARAMMALRNSHFYGRHLVIEWAQQEDLDQLEAEGEGGEAQEEAKRLKSLQSLEGLRKRARKDERVLQQVKGSKKARREGEDVLGDPSVQDVV